MDMENKRFEEAIGCLELEFHKNEDTLPLTEQQEEAYERMMKNMNFDAKDRKVTVGKGNAVFSVLSKVAVVLLCVGVVGFVSATQAEAFKVNFQKLFIWEEEDHITLVPSDYEELRHWENYYIFASLPEGYQQTHAEDLAGQRTIVYECGENTLILQQMSSSSVISVDNEDTTHEKVSVNGKEGHYFNREEDAMSTLIWIEGNTMLTVYSNGTERLAGETLITFVEENLIFQK
jgi:hypothetical protein